MLGLLDIIVEGGTVENVQEFRITVSHESKRGKNWQIKIQISIFSEERMEIYY